MHIVCSIFVIIALFISTIFFVYLIRKNILSYIENGCLTTKTFLTIIVGMLTLIAYSLLWEYTYPFEKTVELNLVEVIEIPTEHTLYGPQNLPWHAAYEKYGLWPGSLYFDTEIKEDETLGIVWPDMDFEHYTYIISYGQEVESLSYNVWETITAPMPRGAKVGHAVLSEEFDPNAIYVYQIKKMRIDNNQ